MTTNEETIKHVCIYIRKSRADSEKDLDNHLIKMVEIAETYSWSYEVFKEIGSGISITERPVFSQLLPELEKGQYDAILLFDQDRLSRGSGADTEKIMWSLRVSDTKIVTGSPFAILDPSNEQDAEVMSIKSFVGNFEYKNINRRLKHGRAVALKKGHWVFGAPPFGYDYNRSTKKLVLNPHESSIVRFIAETYINTSKNMTDIAWELNKQGERTKRGSQWTSQAVSHVLLQDVYQGNIIYGKSEGVINSKDKYSTVPYRKFPKEEWKTIYNTHEAIITAEERELIESKRKTRQTKPRVNHGVFELSGLCYTPNDILYTRHVHYRTKTPTLYIHKDRQEEGDNYIRVPIELVQHAIVESVKVAQDSIAKRLSENDNTKELNFLRDRLRKQEQRHEIVLQSIERVMVGFTEGLYDLPTAKKIKLDKENEQRELELDIKETRYKIDNLSNIKNEDKLERMTQFLKDIENPKTKGYELNQIYKSIIKKIVVSRTEVGTVDIEVNFL